MQRPQVGGDEAQRVVDFMGDAGGQLPHHGKTVGLVEAPLGREQIAVGGGQGRGAFGDPGLEAGVDVLQLLVALGHQPEQAAHRSDQGGAARVAALGLVGDEGLRWRGAGRHGAQLTRHALVSVQDVEAQPAGHEVVQPRQRPHRVGGATHRLDLGDEISVRLAMGPDVPRVQPGRSIRASSVAK
jgi:hypothetical protein